MGRSGKLHDLAEPKRGGLQARLRRVTEVAAVFYSLLESAKVAGVEPAAYLRAATRRRSAVSTSLSAEPAAAQGVPAGWTSRQAQGLDTDIGES
jgi:hypothetical protein